MERALRRSHIHEAFGFWCECELCAGSSPSQVEGANLKAEKEALAEIEELIDAVPRVGSTDQRRALQVSERVLHLLQLVRLDTPMDVASVHYDAFQMAFSCGQRKKDRDHLILAHKSAELIHGVGSPLARRHAERLRML
jgi:hypothetical protein